jgi:diguanylate cyclase (GGDEF)-like protein
MKVKTLNNPMNIMKVLAEYKPDLILMDIYMPECTGLELAKVIRQEAAYINLPIVFLSTETNVDKQYEALRLGGDDFLQKPIQDEHLVSSIISKAQRSRQLGSIIMRDSLTGLLKHSKIKELLQIELLRARRQKLPLAFAMIDIDHFKQINDNYGHMTGDCILHNFARSLQQNLRKTDIIGRYGGEEFAIIFPDTSGLEAIQILDKLRISFAQTEQHYEDNIFKVTFSAGVSVLSDSGSHTKMIQMADEAMYQAKEQGRNFLVLSGEESCTENKVHMSSSL